MPAQLFFYTTLGRIKAKYPSATNSNLGRESGMHESTRTILNRSCPDKAMKVTESRMVGWVASFSTWSVGLKAG